jgi:hypothetical protein
MQIQAHALGHVSPLNAEETQLAGDYNLQPSPVARAWEYWNVRLDKAEGTWRPEPRKTGKAKRAAAKTFKPVTRKPAARKKAAKRRR